MDISNLYLLLTHSGAQKNEVAEGMKENIKKTL